VKLIILCDGLQPEYVRLSSGKCYQQLAMVALNWQQRCDEKAKNGTVQSFGTWTARLPYSVVKTVWLG